ncbi:MAG: hypothetical protein ACK5NF_03225 [Bacilli bacterium]
MENNLILNEMENFMKITKILLVFMIAVLFLLGILLKLSIDNSTNIKYLVNNDLVTKQNFIISTEGMIVNPNIDPNSFRPKVEQALEYCTYPEIVHANGNDVTPQCESLQEYSDANYGG